AADQRRNERRRSRIHARSCQKVPRLKISASRPSEFRKTLWQSEMQSVMRSHQTKEPGLSKNVAQMRSRAAAIRINSDCARHGEWRSGARILSDVAVAVKVVMSWRSSSSVSLSAGRRAVAAISSPRAGGTRKGLPGGSLRTRNDQK